MPKGADRGKSPAETAPPDAPKPGTRDRLPAAPAPHATLADTVASSPEAVAETLATPPPPGPGAPAAPHAAETVAGGPAAAPGTVVDAGPSSSVETVAGGLAAASGLDSHPSAERGSVPAGVDPNRAFPVVGWDRYDFDSFLGQGGMGRVYKAFDPRLKRFVALKFIRGDDPDLNRRFLREAQAQARVEHDNVCRVHEVGEVQGRLYIAMPYLEGENLDRAAAGMTLERKVRVVAQVAEGLHAAHRLGLVHRDVKPANVLVTRAEDGSPHPYVTDFGLARHTQEEGITVTGTLVGTPWYMAPEQALSGKLVDRRADVYGVGATLYELLAGRPPFTGAGPLEVLHSVLNEEPPPLRKLVADLPADLETIVHKCLEKDPNLRYESARALADDLRRFLDGEPIAARSTSLAGRLVRKARRNPALTAAVAGLVAALVAFGAFALHSRVETRRRLQVAQALAQEAKELEVLMRFASYTLPLHDVERERRIVRGRVAALEQRAAALGRAARGPARYAIGRGLLTVGDHRRALPHLEAAWQAGHRTPDVAYALGQVRAHLYALALRSLTTAGSSEERERLQAAHEESYLKPALAALRQARGVQIDAPEFLEAQIALLERDVDRAVERAERAFAAAPWLYEARVVAGHAHCLRADGLRNRGDEEGADAAYERAEAAYREAVDLARSYPEAHLGLCSLFSDRMEQEWNRRLSPAEQFRRAEKACGDALAADPRHGQTLLIASDVQWRWALHVETTGEDPRPALRASIGMAERSLETGFDVGYARDNLGIAYTCLGSWELAHGLDPRPALDQAVAHLRACLREFPRFVSAYCNLSGALVARSQYLQESGGPVDPAPDLEEARSVLRAGRAQRPHTCQWGNQVEAELEQVRQDLLTARDLSPALARLREAAAGARAENPRLIVIETMSARAALLAAERALDEGSSPEAELTTAAAAIARVRALNPGETRLPLLEAEAALLRARQRRDAATLRAAGALFDEALSRGPDDPAVLVRAAWSRLRRMEADPARAAAQAGAGLGLVDRALGRRANLGEAWALKAVFLRALGRGAESRRAEARAREANPRLAAWLGERLPGAGSRQAPGRRPGSASEPVRESTGSLR